jgi:hypothetical protein
MAREAKEGGMNKKAIVLLSGGLDSILATRLMLEQGIEVIAFNFTARFWTCSVRAGESAASKAAAMLKVPLRNFDFTLDFMQMIKEPRYGHGANMNPCIDCKIYMLKKAKGCMQEYGASFIVTGEVLGERPMSQRRDVLMLIERESGLKGLLLRPLSAKLLEPTLPEKEGVVDREMLMDIRGRSRKPQMALARKFGITEYPNPAGGCLLTDPGFARRVKDLINHGSFDQDNLDLLTVGRHFRLSDDTKLVVGRDDGENGKIASYVKAGDITFRLADIPGPFSLLRGAADREMIDLAAGIAAYHTKSRKKERLKVEYCEGPSKDHRTVSVAPAKEGYVKEKRI